MKHNAKKTLALLLALVMVLSLVPAMGIAAYADDTSYILTIPSTLTVADKGWNATDGISATGTLATGKKLTVTASSANSWALKSGDNSVGYNLATATGTYSSTAQPASWEFTELSSTAATKPMGIIVENYDDKPAGTYTDTVTFTASVVSAKNKLTLTGEYFDRSAGFVKKSLEIEYTDNDTWKDIAERYEEVSLLDNIYGPSESKVVMFWHDEIQRIEGCQLKSTESTYNYDLVSINDKVSAYSSYYLEE